jgi:hypothetical protein
MTAVECYRCPRARKRHARHLAECETRFNRSFPRFALALKLLSLSTLNKACLIRNSAESPRFVKFGQSLAQITCRSLLWECRATQPSDCRSADVAVKLGTQAYQAGYSFPNASIKPLSSRRRRIRSSIRSSNLSLSILGLRNFIRR